jgi:hypothetical protein
MHELKKINPASIPRDLDKARLYRKLNEPWLAQNICMDILAVQPENQDAIVQMILAITDSFGHPNAASLKNAKRLLPQLEDDYDRVYYEGIVYERWGYTHINKIGHGPMVYDAMRTAMDCFETANELTADDNDDPVLRYNACLRTINRYPDVAPVDDPDAIVITGDGGDVNPLAL